MSSILSVTWSRSGEVPLYYQGRPEEEDYYYDYSDEYYQGYPEYRSLVACFDRCLYINFAFVLLI